MFLGIGALVNPAAIQLTKANAYTAAKVVLGLNAPQTQLMKIAEDYTRHIIPRANRAPTVPMILGDFEFSKFVSQAKDGIDGAASAKIENTARMLGGSFSLGDSLLFGIPNYLLYAGLGAAGYWYVKKKKAAGWKLFSKPASVSAVPASTTPAVKV